MTGETDLVLSVHAQRALVQPGDAVPLEVALDNRGPSELVVNARLGMGYPDSADRELYCEILRDGEPYTDYRRYVVDYRRKPLDEASFEKLRPGQRVTSKFDLQYWYHLDGPGQYQVRVVYEPGRHASHPEAFSDRVVSEAITLTVSE